MLKKRKRMSNHLSHYWDMAKWLRYTFSVIYIKRHARLVVVSGLIIDIGIHTYLCSQHTDLDSTFLHNQIMKQPTG